MPKPRTLCAVALALACVCNIGNAALRFKSAQALVMDEATGVVLLGKDIDNAVPIASLTKLITAMVVLDAKQDSTELVRIDDVDVDMLKHSRSRVPVGEVLSREALLELALIPSDNRAAAALARTYPGGMVAFHAAVLAKIEELGLHKTVLVEPTGLSPENRSSAQDLAQVLKAAAHYPEIAGVASRSNQVVRMGGHDVQFRNTNALVGRPGWNILLSKTGFTNEAGRCLTMRIASAGRTLLVVLLGATDVTHRTMDAVNVQRWLAGTTPTEAMTASARVVRMPRGSVHLPKATPAASLGRAVALAGAIGRMSAS